MKKTNYAYKNVSDLERKFTPTDIKSRIGELENRIKELEAQLDSVRGLIRPVINEELRKVLEEYRLKHWPSYPKGR